MLVGTLCARVSCICDHKGQAIMHTSTEALLPSTRCRPAATARPHTRRCHTQRTHRCRIATHASTLHPSQHHQRQQQHHGSVCADPLVALREWVTAAGGYIDPRLTGKGEVSSGNVQEPERIVPVVFFLSFMYANSQGSPASLLEGSPLLEHECTFARQGLPDCRHDTPHHFAAGLYVQVTVIVGSQIQLQCGVHCLALLARTVNMLLPV